MIRKALPLAFVLALVAAACAEHTEPEVRFGSGARFVPFVADPLNDAGRYPAVVANESGLPVAAYLGFEEEVEEGEFPQARPVMAPSLPGVLLTTASADGIWTRGAIAIQSQIPNVNVAFNPGFDDSITDLGPGNVTGLQIVADGDMFHAAWGSADGLFYATGSLDPDTTTQVSIEPVSNTPPVGPSIALVNGDPWISYSSSTSASAAVVVASRAGGEWEVERVADAAGCETCPTAMVEVAGDPAVAYTDGGDGVSLAVNGGDGWTSRQVSGSGGHGLSGVGGDDVALAFYDGTQVVAASGAASGSFETAPIAEVAQGSGAAEGAGTSLAVDDQGSLWAAWLDGAEGVGFASSAGDGFQAIDTGGNTTGGAMPSVAVTPDGSTAYLAWYDAENQDLLLGAYGELEGLALAAPSPQPGGSAAPPPSDGGGQDCTEPEDGVVTITALGIQFDTRCVRVPEGEAVQIEFVNEDDGIPHNVAIYPSADEISADAAFLQGEIFEGVDTRTYDVPAMDAGEYYFHCDVHPNMNGVWIVGEGDGATGGTGATGGAGATGATDGGGGAGELTVVAQNIAFDTSTIQLPADTPVTITFDNRDAGVQHNIAIYTDDTLAEELFNGEIFPGPDTRDYEIPALPPGEYYFLCVVHPTQMTGTVVVG
jgi:plastocyanin